MSLMPNAATSAVGGEEEDEDEITPEQMADLMENFGIRDDASIAESALRFSVGNLVIYKPRGMMFGVLHAENTVGWYEGEVVKVSQRMIYSEDRCGKYIAYIVWPRRDLPDDELGTEWVLEDTDEFIRPRPADLTPDPAKFKPLFVAPDDPYYYLYTDTKHFDSTTEEDEEIENIYRRMGVDDAKTKPDGSVMISHGGKRLTTSIVEIPREPILGVDPYTAMMFSSHYLSVRERTVYTKTLPDMIETFKALDPGMSLAQLEVAAKSSSSKMLLLGDCMMLGLHGWPRDFRRACNLYRAAAWGCTEDEEPLVSGISVGDPKAMIAAASLSIYQLKTLCGYNTLDSCSFHELIGKGLASAQNMQILHQLFQWLTDALRYHGHSTSLTLVIGKTIKDMNLISDRRLMGDMGDNLKVMGGIILQAAEYREKEIEIERMQEKGLLPRGDPQDEVIQIFKIRAREIFLNLPKKDDIIHIEFKRVPRPPFPMVVISFLPSIKKVVKIVRLPRSLQLTPFSIASFEHVWLRIAFDIHLGRPGSNERCRPKAITVLDDGHGNRKFALFLKEMLGNCDTEVRLVAHSDTIKSGKRSRSTLGDIASEMMTRLLDVPGFLVDDEFQDDIVARAQEEYVDHVVSQMLVDGEADGDALHLLESERMKERGNQYFQRQDLTSAIRCYSLALGHLRRILEHNNLTYKLLGTTLSNRAACFLDLNTQRSYSTDFRQVHARNAINDCTTALESSWASSSLPQSILDKLRFRLDKATASFDSLNEGGFSVADVLFPTSNQTTGREFGNAIRQSSQIRNAEMAHDYTETNREDNRQDSATGIQRKSASDDVDADALLEYGEVLYENHLAKNAKDGCPICLREFNGQLVRSYCVVLPCGEHALCASCLCSLKIQADKAKQCPQCPLCRFSFNCDFVEGVPSVVIEKDQAIANLIVQLANMDHSEKIAVAERLLWTHRFEVSAVVDALEELLDGRASVLFFRSEGDLTHKQKEDIYRKARISIEKLEEKLRQLLQEQSLADSTSLDKICCSVRQVRRELGEAREKSREEIYGKMNNVGTMGAEVEGGMIQVDYHGLHVSGMRKKFKDHILPIIPEVKKVMIITGRGSHSVGKESKLKKALQKLIGEYENLYWQRVEDNNGAILVLWRTKKNALTVD